VNEVIEVLELKDITTIDFNKENIYFGYIDPSTLGHHPGWPLRNYLVLIAKYAKIQSLKILCLRDNETSNNSQFKSVVLHVTCPPIGDVCDLNKSVGWELNHKGQLAPRLVNLQATMDPLK
jgi:ubiquitin-like modifier-activating enzyme ATG7